MPHKICVYVFPPSSPPAQYHFSLSPFPSVNWQLHDVVHPIDLDTQWYLLVFSLHASKMLAATHPPNNGSSLDYSIIRDTRVGSALRMPYSKRFAQKTCPKFRKRTKNFQLAVGRAAWECEFEEPNNFQRVRTTVILVFNDVIRGITPKNPIGIK